MDLVCVFRNLLLELRPKNGFLGLYYLQLLWKWPSLRVNLTDVVLKRCKRAMARSKLFIDLIKALIAVKVLGRQLTSVSRLRVNIKLVRVAAVMGESHWGGAPVRPVHSTRISLYESGCRRLVNLAWVVFSAHVLGHWDVIIAWVLWVIIMTTSISAIIILELYSPLIIIIIILELFERLWKLLCVELLKEPPKLKKSQDASNPCQSCYQAVWILPEILNIIKDLKLHDHHVIIESNGVLGNNGS